VSYAGVIGLVDLAEQVSLKLPFPPPARYYRAHAG
jgi:hypothetical protein